MKNVNKGSVITAIFIIGVLLFLTCYEPKPTQEYNIVIFGDSILGNNRTSNSISHLLEAQLEQSVLNLALGGTAASQKNGAMKESNLHAALTLVDIINAIYYEDFGQMNMIINYGRKHANFNHQIFPYFEEVLAQIKDTDFSKVEILIISYGINDYMGGNQLRSENEEFDKKTVEGSLSYSIMMLQNKYPNLKIYLTTPMNCIFEVDGQEVDGNMISYGGGHVVEYVQVIEEVAEKYQIPVINFYQEMDITLENWNQYLFDKVHPNETGLQILSQIIGQSLNKE